MKNNIRTWAAICSAVLAVTCTGCAGGNMSSGDSSVADSTISDTAATDNSQSPDNAGSTGATTPQTAATTSVITPDTVSEKDSAPATVASCTIALSDSGTTINGNGAVLNGNTITINKAGNYEISGSCSDIGFIIDADSKDDVTLILNNAQISSKSSAAITCSNADKLVITLAAGSKNIISDGTSYNTDEDSPDAAIFSSDDLIINGSGTLEITANCQNGIKGKDDVKICGGNIIISSVDNGIIGKDYLLIDDGTLDITAKGDGIKSTNDTDAELGYISITGGSIKINTDKDAIQAETQLLISGGDIAITTGGGSETVQHNSDGGWGDFRPDKERFDFSNMTNSSGQSTESTKGLKATKGIMISGGNITIDSADDSIHSDADIHVSDGSIVISSGDDALHAENDLTISGGDIEITRSYEALESMSLSILGGNINAVSSDDGINVAGGDNAEYFNSSDTAKYYFNMSGGNVTINAAGDGIDSNGTITISGGTLIVHGPQDGANGALDYQSACEVNGGTLIALGSMQMSMSPSSSTQPCITVNGNIPSDTTVEVCDSSGSTVFSVTALKNCQSLVFSCEKLVAGEKYNIYAGDSLIAEVTAENATGAQNGGFGGGHGGMGGHNGGMTPPGGFDKPDNGNFQGGMTPPEMQDKPISRNNTTE